MTRQLLESGNTVYALARTPNKSKELQELKNKFPDRLKIFAVDINSDEQVSHFARELGSSTPIDVLINNAGVYGEATNELEKLSLQKVIETLATNSVAPMRVTRALLPNLRRGRDPKVVSITSLMGSIQDNESGGSYGYRMSKAALNMFHKSFAADFQEFTSLVIHPGWVKTDMGGPSAPIEPEDSARGILQVIEKATPEDSGSFFDFEGDELPW